MHATTIRTSDNCSRLLCLRLLSHSRYSILLLYLYTLQEFTPTAASDDDLRTALLYSRSNFEKVTARRNLFRKLALHLWVVRQFRDTQRQPVPSRQRHHPP